MEFTQATRNLCAGAYLDSAFAQRVLLKAYADRNRHIAPSYGFDVTPVALHARRAWLIDVLQHAALILAVWLVASSAVVVIVAGGVLVVWHAVGELVRLAAGFGRYMRDRRSISDFLQFRVRLVLVVVKVGVALVVVFVSLVLGVGFSAVAAVWNDGDTGAVRGVGVSAAHIVLLVAAVVVGGAALRQWAMTAVVNSVVAPRIPLDRRLRHLAMEQRSPVTFYSGYRPFVGSGEEIDTWSLTLRLLHDPQRDAAATPAEPDDDGGADDIDLALEASLGGARTGAAGAAARPDSEREVDALPFTGEDLIGKIRSELLRLKDADEEICLPGIDVQDRYFVTEMYAPMFARDPDGEMAKAERGPTEPVRRYLACTVQAWDGEIVTSVFVSASLQGRMLHLEFSVWALLPTRPDFHVADLAGRRAVAWHVGHALRRIRDLPDEVRRLPGDLWTALPLAGRTVASLGAVAPWPGRNCGARFSVREDGAITRYVAFIAAQLPANLVPPQHRRVLLIEESEPRKERAALEAVREAERLARQAARAVNYFQLRDVQRHWKVVERRVIAAVLDLLEEKGIDTAEYRSRVVQIMNNGGFMNFGTINAPGGHFGSGDVDNTFAGAGENGQARTG